MRQNGVSEPVLGGMVQTAADRSEPLLRPGNTNCGGCGMSVALQLLSRAVAEKPVRLVIPACCAIVTAGPFPSSGYGAPVVASTFASAAAVATGLAHAARLNGDDLRVLCFAGDGGTYDIGLATLSAAAERDEDILFLCYDNEIYGNTGGQRSSATPLGATTSTTPAGKEVGKKDILAILAAHRIPYAATVSLAHPEDGLRKLRYALALPGFRFVHLLAPCPTGWKSEPADTLELVRLAVSSGLYPVCEVFGGTRWVVNIEPDAGEEALPRYLSLQGRFGGHGTGFEALQRQIRAHWAHLRHMAAPGELGP